jgi:hypothetical protein
MQHMMRFSTTKDCFQNFRLVCKQWKNIVETIRFNRFVYPSFFNKLDNAFLNNPTLAAAYCQNYLPLFKKLHMRIENFQNETEIFSIVLSNMKGLTEIHLRNNFETTNNAEWSTFVLQLLTNLHKTLKALSLDSLEQFVIPEAQFPNLSKLKLGFYSVT